MAADKHLSECSSSWHSRYAENNCIDVFFATAKLLRLYVSCCCCEAAVGTGVLGSEDEQLANLPADTTDSSSLRKFCESVTKGYLLTFGTVYFVMYSWF